MLQRERTRIFRVLRFSVNALQSPLL